MNKAEKKFRLFALAAIFVLFTVLLAVINGVNFTMTAADADEITLEIAGNGGTFSTSSQSASGEMSPEPFMNAPAPTRQGPLGRFGPMGPSSPETTSSVRYFTIAFTPDGDYVRTVAYEISAVTETEAIEWASGLLHESTGWTSGTYRYRAYQSGNLLYVTVIDQGRELLAAYRILLISSVGEILCLIAAWIVLKLVGRRLFAPLEDADRKQKKFIANANNDFRLPLTIIGAETELIEKEHGPDDRTRSIHRQLHKLGTLLSQLDSLAIFSADPGRRAEIELSDLLRSTLEPREAEFAEKGLTLEIDIAPDITLTADPDAIKRVIDELIENALRYARGNVRFILKRVSDRVILETRNGTELPPGPADQVFDRFTTLENAKDSGTAGLGLAYVKDIVRAHAGRAVASVNDGTFTLRIAL